MVPDGVFTAITGPLLTPVSSGMLQEGGLKAASLVPFQVPFLFPYGRSLWMELRASSDITPLPQLISPLLASLSMGYSVWLHSCHLMMPCPRPLFLLPRGTARVTQKRTSPGGKPFTPGGGAVPPNWPGLKWLPGRSKFLWPCCASSRTLLDTMIQTFCVPEHFARERSLQDSELSRDPGSRGCLSVESLQHSSGS